MRKVLPSSIRRRYLVLSLSILFFLATAGAGAFIYMKDSQDELKLKREAMYEKQVELEQLRDSLNDLFFRVRGYIAYQNSTELDRAYTDIEQVHRSLQDLQELNLTETEQQMIVELTAFLDTYENEALPSVIVLVGDNDYKGVRTLASGGMTAEVNRFIEYVKQYKTAIDDDLESLSEDMLQQANLLTFGTITFILFMYLFISYFIWRMMNDIVKPLERIREVADDFTSGKSFSLLPVDRNDEIGVLNASFGSMIRTIQDKEEELMAQNEELVMQQEELQEHQAKIEESLAETNQTKDRLERYNELNHVLSFSLNKQELSHCVLDYLDKVYQLDLGLFWIRDSGEHALKGVTKSMFSDFQNSQSEYVDQRLKEAPFFTIKREAVQEKGLALDPVYVHDYFAGVHHPNGDMAALFGGSRIGRDFTAQEQKDMLGLLNRVYLAIERIQLYDRNVQERMLNERIINNINEGIQFVGTDGEMLQRNEALGSILDCGHMPLDAALEKEEWIDRLANQADDPLNMKVFIGKCLNQAGQGVSKHRYKVIRPTERVVDVYSAPVMIDGIKTGTIFVHRDITKEYEVDQMKTELVSTVSHELRTPLSSVLGFTELLLHKQLKPEKQKKYLETIYKEAKRLTNLINDFLDLQRMETGSQVYRMDEILLNEIAVEAIGRFRSESSHPFVIVDEAPNVKVEGDRDRIAQVLTNIIGNAVKFSPDGGHVTLTLSNEADQVVVSVRDEGIGIPSEDVPKLFNKFQRIDNSARRKIGGTGLGLAICREIIEKHNGSISIESDEGVGTTVRFSLPLVSAGTSQMIGTETQENSPSVMIVEDDMSLALLLSEELKMNGFTVIYHMSPMDAFEEAKRTDLVGVVIDIMLGDELDGWDLVRLLKEEKKTRHIPIIISSALDPHQEAGHLSQIDHYLTKPYPPKQLSKAVLGFLSEPVQKGVIFYPEEGSDEHESK